VTSGRGDVVESFGSFSAARRSFGTATVVVIATQLHLVRILQ
jgi:hypothetical protein